jgi:hypothetical protein
LKRDGWGVYPEVFLGVNFVQFSCTKTVFWLEYRAISVSFLV